MRTTLDIEDDVLLAVKQLARKRNQSAGAVVSTIVRNALRPRRKATVRDGVPLFPVQPKAGVASLELVNRLRDEAL